MKHIDFNIRQVRGFGLLEVVLAIAVFAFGFLALMQLQSSLARSSSDANTRTVAANIAEELIETARGFTQTKIDADNGRMDYNEISTYGSYATVPVGGLNYKVHVTVNDHYWDATVNEFTTTKPTGIVNSDIKTMDIVVVWEDLDREWPTDHDSIDFSEGGAIRIVEMVPSTPGLLGALVSANKDASGGPLVDYNPGANPDIVRIKLDGVNNSKFKEATSPTPDVIRDDAVETWFDVVTYSQANGVGDATFLRREEFVAVSCECELDTNPAEADWGLKPTLWNGVTYTEGAKVDKPIGTVPGGVQQSAYCTVCCRDHHDVDNGGLEDVYDIHRYSSTDHPHYSLDKQGNVVPAAVGNGKSYVEACRLVRKDGFMRVTQDANQGSLVGFPEGYLEFDQGAVAYSNYVIDAVTDYYDSAGANFQGTLEQPNPPDNASTHVFPARVSTDGTDLPTATFADSQQLRARGIYTDYLTTAAQSVVTECFLAKDAPTVKCLAPNAASPLEIYPFFDVQMTWLARWTNESNDPSMITLSNDPIKSGNTHSRGVAKLAASGDKAQTVKITSHHGNLGLTSTAPIDPYYDAETTDDRLYIDIRGSSAPGTPLGTVVSGGLSSAVRVDPSELMITSETAYCGQTNTDWSCVTIDGGEVTVSGYYQKNPTVYVCSDLVLLRETTGDSPLDYTTTFELPKIGSGLDIWLTADPDCVK